jgi:hypothetical protein
MRKLALGLVAAGALITATAVPALAQVDVYAGPGGVGIGIGAPGYHHGYHGAPDRRGYAYEPGYRYHHGWREHYYGHRPD